jgi:hypothetical protein
MPDLFVATTSGCHVFSEAGEAELEMTGHSLGPFARDDDGCIALVDHNEIWRRDRNGAWSHIVTAPIPLQSIVSVNGTIYAGGMEEAAMLRVCADGTVARIDGFDQTPGRDEWIANGPPLGVRSLAAAQNVVLAAVHVGGIPRSTDGGQTWKPTIPILHDAHQLSMHPSQYGFVAAAAAVGLCISHDSGESWQIYGDGSEAVSALAAAVLEDEVLYSLQDGPFAKESQLWRWRMEDGRIEQVHDGSPERLEGKIDTNWIAAAHHQAALIDKGGDLWWSQTGSTHWKRIANIPPHVTGLFIL